MQLELTRTQKPFQFHISNPAGFFLQTDASEKAGGAEQGFRPMELLLAGLASCTSIDVILILQKQKQVIQDYRVHVSGTRTDAVPAVFTQIHLQVDLYGDIDAKKATRAVNLSLEKYCSAAAMLNKTAEITADVTVHPADG